MFGSGENGQLGTGKLEKELFPCYIEFKEHVRRLSCGQYHTLILNDNGRIYAAGQNNTGQLGLEHKKKCHIFTKIPFFENINIKQTPANAIISFFFLIINIFLKNNEFFYLII